MVAQEGFTVLFLLQNIKLSYIAFFMLINVGMLTIDGILRFMSIINIKLSKVEPDSAIFCFMSDMNVIKNVNTIFM